MSKYVTLRHIFVLVCPHCGHEHHKYDFKAPDGDLQSMACEECGEQISEITNINTSPSFVCGSSFSWYDYNRHVMKERRQAGCTGLVYDLIFDLIDAKGLHKKIHQPNEVHIERIFAEWYAIVDKWQKAESKKELTLF